MRAIPQHLFDDNMNTKQPGRPRYQIRTDRLERLREETQLTQRQLANLLYAQLGKKSSTERTRETGYQRIESKGRTSKKTAEALVQVLASKLGRSAESIQEELGGASLPDRREEMEVQLRKQQDRGNPSLLRALARYQGDPDPVKSLAFELVGQLEWAFLGRPAELLGDLEAITGLSSQELLRPVSLLGHWMLVHVHFLGREVQVFVGVADVLEAVRQRAIEWLDEQSESDCFVNCSEEGPWLRIRLGSSARSNRWSNLSFVRCSPGVSGLSWAKPTSWDRYFIDQLTPTLWNHCNFMTGFASEDFGTHDVTRLGLALCDMPRFDPFAMQAVEAEPTPQIRALHGFDFSVIPAALWDERKSVGMLHDYAMAHLKRDLWTCIEPHLSHVPAAWWRLRALPSGIELAIDWNTQEPHRRGLSEDSGARFLLALVETSKDGTVRPVPWRHRSMLDVRAHLSTQLTRGRDEASPGAPESATLRESR